MSNRFVDFRELKATHRTITSSILYVWKKHCSALGRPIRTIPNPANPKSPLFSLDDVIQAMAARPATALPDQFADSRGTWIAARLLPSGAYPISRSSILDWSKRGCVALEGKKLEIRRERSWPSGVYQHRDYVRVEDLDKIVAARAADVQDDDPNWMKYSDAVRLFSKKILIRYSDSQHYIREKPGEAHPALSRPIKTRTRKKLVRGQAVTTVEFWRADLIKLLNQQAPDASLWATWKQAQDEYLIPAASLVHAAKTGKVKVRKFATAPGVGRPPLQQFFSRADLRRYAQHRENRKDLPKHDSIDRRIVDGGGIWLPARDTENIAGINSAYFKRFRKTCPLLNDRPLRAKMIQPHWKSSADKVWVYLEEDAKAIRRKLNKLPDLPLAAASPSLSSRPDSKNAGGRPRADDKYKRACFGLRAEWLDAKHNGYTQKEFAKRKDINLSLESLKAMLKFCSTREKRGQI